MIVNNIVTIAIIIASLSFYASLTEIFISKVLSQLIEQKHIHNANPFPIAFLCGWLIALIFYGLLPNDCTLPIQFKKPTLDITITE